MRIARHDSKKIKISLKVCIERIITIIKKILKSVPLLLNGLKNFLFFFSRIVDATLSKSIYNH